MFRFLILFFTILTSVNLMAQQLRVLVIPFDKFQFECNMTTSEIALYNELSGADQVYDVYTQALLEAINESSDSLSIYEMDENSLNLIRRQLPRVYKREPISHNGVDIEAYAKSGDLKKLLENMGADYLMVISRYKIMGKIITARGSWSSSAGFINWSIHQVDYEIFNAEGDLVALADRFTIRPRNPRNETYTTQGTLTEDLWIGMLKLGLDIEQKALKYQKKGKVVYKSKIK